MIGARSALADRVLAHHVYQGRTNDCGPCCVAMVVNAVRPFAVDAVAVGRALERPRRRLVVPVPQRWPRSATFPWGVALALGNHGLGAEWRFGGRTAALREALARGAIPLVVLGGWRPLWAHWLVVLAWDPGRGWGVADPASPDAVLVWIPPDLFRRRWNRYGRILVRTGPLGALAPPAEPGGRSAAGRPG